MSIHEAVDESIEAVLLAHQRDPAPVVGHEPVVAPQDLTAQPGEKKVDEGSFLISYYTGKTRCSNSEDYAVSTTWSQRRMIIYGMRSHYKPPPFG